VGTAGQVDRLIRLGVLDVLLRIDASEEIEEESASFAVTGVRHEGTSTGRKDVILTMAFRTHADPPAEHVVEIRGVGAVGQRTVLGPLDSAIALVDDHPLLWSCLWPDESLFFADSPKDAFVLRGELEVTHGRLTNGLLPFAVSAPDVLAGAGGIVARGPRPLLDAYAEVLIRHGVRPSAMTGTRRPGVWWALVVPTFPEQTFVVARSFSEQWTPGPPQVQDGIGID
jgi:hypothetical protein